MRIVLLHIALLLLPLQVTVAQTLTYEITWRGDSIGYLKAERDKSGSFISYELESYTSFNMLLSYSMLTTFHSVYKDGRLLSASSKNFVNDKQKDYSTIKYLEDAYHIDVNNEVRREALEIDESITTLYFSPPESNSTFSERFGIHCKIEKVDESTYDLILPDGKRNTYYYRNGICDKVKIRLALATIELHRIK